MKKKTIGLLVSLVLLLTVSVGATLAFLIDQTDPLPNTFTPSEVTVQVNETFNGTTKSNVSIKNTGDTEAYIRAAIVVTWQNAAGEVYGVPVESGDYTLTLSTTDGWDIETTDGYYYYTSPVAPGTNTGILIDSCTAGTKPEGIPNDYYLSVEIIASGIQSVPTSVVAEQWGVTVASDGTISK